MARKARNYPRPRDGEEAPLPVKTGRGQEERMFFAALYVRLSKEDGGKDNGNTVDNQQALLREFIENQPCMRLYDTYIDNGFSGTSFGRPAFQKMMADAMAGKINCIIVKDLSRLGRNYLEAGEYLEKIFPALNLRFISVTDHFDTWSPSSFEDGITIPLKNLVNEIYAKDISRKIGPALDMKKAEGRYGGGAAPYGYRKSAAQKGRYEIDEQAAEVVRHIYQMRAGGCSYCGIVKTLNEKGVKSPSAYRFEKGIVKDERMQKSPWNRYAIRDMLHDEVYLGNMVRGKTHSAFYKGEKRHPVARTEWIVVQGTHDPVISRELFDAVQRVNEEKTQNHASSKQR